MCSQARTSLMGASPEGEGFASPMGTLSPKMRVGEDVKLPIYARHGIAEVWLVDAEDEMLAIYLDPSPKGYRRLVTPSRNETVSPLRLPKVGVRLADLW